MISVAKEVIAICDSSKFQKRGFAFFAPVSKIHTIVTDVGIQPDIYDQLIKLGKRLLLPQSSNS